MASEPLDGLKTLLLALGGVCVSWLLFPFLKIIKKNFITFFDCAGSSSLLCMGFLWLWQVEMLVFRLLMVVAALVTEYGL